MNANPPVLALKGVSKRFGPVQALSDVDFEIHDGEVVALVGDNGAGKSTMVKAIAGIHGADDGQILFEGKEVKIAGPTDATDLGIATVYQDLALCDNLDVVENLFLGRRRSATGRPRSDGRDLDGEANRRAAAAARGHDQRARGGRHDVRGQRQQVAIARSLLGDPKLVMLDEPTAALGSARRRWCWA